MRRLVNGMFVLMAGAVSADALPVAALEAKIRGMADENMTAGMSVVVVKGDKVVYQQAFGYRDKDTREPLDVNDIFRIASISKSFSGMSIMQLVEAGKMSLDDDVNDILGMDIRNPRYPDIPARNTASPPASRRALSRASGLSATRGAHTGFTAACTSAPTRTGGSSASAPAPSPTRSTECTASASASTASSTCSTTLSSGS